MATHKPGGGLSSGPNQDGTLTSEFQLLEPWEVKVDCLSPPVYGLLL